MYEEHVAHPARFCFTEVQEYCMAKYIPNKLEYTVPLLSTMNIHRDIMPCM